jgi:hypothetical protein
MKKNFKTAITLGVTICGLVVQLACHAQSATSTPDNVTTPQSASAATPNNDAVIRELAEMKARIAQLEAELKAGGDANALRTAEGTAVSGGSSSSVTPIVPAAAVTTPAAAPAPPEINAQTTTKGEPFEGDWTWLNSNGHAVDSPMSTKYFTPEFRADANYILDYNHPHDDTMGRRYRELPFRRVAA